MAFMHVWRLLKINRTLLRFGLNRSLIPKKSKSLLALSYFNPWSFSKNNHNRGESLREMFERLGPVFIKFGQVLSTRRDLLPGDIADALAGLQDSVAPFPGKQALAIVEHELQQPLSDLFSQIDEQPLAAASIAQVHAATTHSGEDVVLKILRPNIDTIIQQDLRLMHTCARSIQRLWKKAGRLNLPGLVREFEQTIIHELDMMREASNASQLRRNFSNDNKLKVPKVHWTYCSPRVLCTERVYGVRISDISALKAAGTDMHKLAAHGVEIFFTQVLRDNFFHADMHPGNLFVDIRNPKSPVYMGVDFGIMGTLSPDDQLYLAKNLHAFFRRDYHEVARLHIECGWVPTDTRVDQFESAIRAVSEPIFERPLAEISFAQLLLRLFQTAEQFNMELRPELMLLQKTLLNIEGLGRQLYPELDLWQTAQPFLEKWLRDKNSLCRIGKEALNDIPNLLEKALRSPGLIHDVLQQQLQRDRQPAPAEQSRRLGPTLYLAIGLLAGVAINHFGFG